MRMASRYCNESGTTVSHLNHSKIVYAFAVIGDIVNKLCGTSKHVTLFFYHKIYGIEIK